MRTVSSVRRSHRKWRIHPIPLEPVTTQLALLPGWLDPSNLIDAMGTWAVLGIMLIIFAECGILLGFFLPGDTLLFVSGLFIATGAIDVNLWVFIALVSLAAFVGNMVGFAIGWKIGPPVFSRPNAKFLKHEYIEKSEAFFAKYGKITIVLARFVPVVRTVATVMAGASRMNPRIYTLYSAIGGVLWVGSRHRRRLLPRPDRLHRRERRPDRDRRGRHRHPLQCCSGDRALGAPPPQRPAGTAASGATGTALD